MNVGLAKPIHAIWFTQGSLVDLHQSLAASLYVNLTSWLRDHPSLPGAGRLLRRTIRIIPRGAPCCQQMRDVRAGSIRSR
jgi:hypothetical protein